MISTRTSRELIAAQTPAGHYRTPLSGAANPYADDPFEWGLQALVDRTVAIAR